MWQGVACGRVLAHVAGGRVHVSMARGIWQGEWCGHVAGAGDMWQDVGATCPHPSPCHMTLALVTYTHPLPLSPHPATCHHPLPHAPTPCYMSQGPVTCPHPLPYGPSPCHMPPPLPYAPTPCHMSPHPAKCGVMWQGLVACGRV